MAYRKLAHIGNLPEGSVLEILDGNRVYALCNVAGEVRAMWGICPHHGGPLGQGALNDGAVTCPWHAWEFDSANGECLFNRDLKIPTYPVRVEAGDILVDLPEHA